MWDWKHATKIASNKISFNVKAISIEANGGCFVAAGNRHLKYWYVDKKQKTVSGTVPLLGRSAILGDHRNNNFLDVSFGLGDMVCINPFIQRLMEILIIRSERHTLHYHEIRPPVSA